MDTTPQTNPPPASPAASSAASSPVLLVVVWLIVGVPALWGVSKTVQTSLNLFNPPAATQPATSAAR